MTEKTWNITSAQWEQLAAAVRASKDPLEDGAFALVERHVETNSDVLVFYASSLNKPKGWPYAFPENIPISRKPVASIGRAWFEAATGFVQFEVGLYAAAQALAADYEGGAGDYDELSYELALQQSVQGRPEDEYWLQAEFARLTKLVL